MRTGLSERLLICGSPGDPGLRSDWLVWMFLGGPASGLASPAPRAASGSDSAVRGRLDAALGGAIAGTHCWQAYGVSIPGLVLHSQGATHTNALVVTCSYHF